MVFNNNFYTVITNSANIVLDNSNPNAITNVSGANIISEGEYNALKWNINTATGNYTVPFTTSSFVKIPLELTIATAGVGSNSSVLFSTFETTNDNNIPYPSDVTNMNADCGQSNGLNTIDRFWIIDANSYTTKPSVTINFGYDDSPNEIAATNTIAETALKAERFNSTLNKWEAPLKLTGFANTAQNKVNNAFVSPIDFYRSWTLVDSSSLKIIITPTVTNVACYGQSTGFIEVGVNSGSAVTYTWSNGVYTSALVNIAAGNYSISVIDANKCFGISTISVTQPNAPLTTLITNSIVGVCNVTESSLEVTANGGTPNYNYLWIPSGNTSPSLLNVSSGTYSLFVTDANGCMDTLVAFLNCLEEEIALFVPQLFSPNADGKNDVFEIKGIENYPNNNIEIFNRWGNLVYSKKSYNNDWNGKPNASNTIKNDFLPAGAYFVILNFGSETTKEPYKGYVMMQQ